MKSPKISLDVQGSVAKVVIDNAEKRNAFDHGMWEGLREAFVDINASDRIRCAILESAHANVFAAGADISEFNTLRASSSLAQQYAQVTNAALQAVAACRVPVIAKIGGACIGGGLELAALADIRVSSESATYGMPVSRLGLCASYEELEGIVGLCGPARMLELLLTATVIDAQTALSYGLVNFVVANNELDHKVDGIAFKIMAGAPISHQLHKKFVRRLARGAALSDTERLECFSCFDTLDYKEGVHSFLRKTKPVFKGM